MGLLKNKILVEQVPFSDRGSRIMLFKERGGRSLYIKLAERWVRREAQLGSYRVRAPIISNIQLLDGEGSPLDFAITTYPHKLILQTRCGSFQLAFQDAETLYISPPPGRVGLSLRAYSAAGATDRRGGHFREGAGGRNIAYTANSPVVENSLARLDGSSFLARFLVEARPNSGIILNITPRLGFNRVVLPADLVLAEVERRWRDWFQAVPPVEEAYRQQYLYAWWIMRCGLLSPRFYITREGMTPSKTHYIGVWQWDAYFHALAYRHLDMRLAEDQLRLLLDHQLDNGMIPDAVHDEGVVVDLATPVHAAVTKPPLIAWAALKLYQLSRNRDFLDEIYEPLVRWNAWWFDLNDDDRDGIVQYNHPFSSGLDDSPLWDQGMPVEAPDLNTYLCVQMDALARIAQELWDEKEAQTWREKAQALVSRLVKHCWDAKAGIFWATINHQPIPTLTPFNLYPLWTGRLGRSMARRLVEHLTDHQEFWTDYPIPTVAKCDPKYNPNQMWRGPTWVNINYIFIEALAMNGYLHLARELRDRTLKLVMGQSDIYEYYHPETGERPPKAAPIFGWSAALFIDLAIKRAQGKII
ncbi:MAG: trehalase family glycosidase [Chloroflexota bacterium]